MFNTEHLDCPHPAAAAHRAGSQPGGLEGIYASAASISGGQGSRCYKLYRFYPDGTALYADFSCFDGGAITASLAEIESWLKPGNLGVSQGDYATQAGLIWARIVVYDSITGAVSLRSFQGEVCSLRYIAPDGTTDQPKGTGEVTADSQGFCYWIWQVGEASGDATVTIQIDAIRQDLRLEVR